MTTGMQHGAPQFPTLQAAHKSSSRDTLDQALQALTSKKDSWNSLDNATRIAILDALIVDFAAIAPHWVEASIQAKGIKPDAPTVGEEWSAGVWTVLYMLRQLRKSLIDIQKYGQPQIPGPVTQRTNGQVVAQVFPFRTYDRLFFQGITAEIWMQPEVTKEKLSATQALNYKQQMAEGQVALVLGAGNVSSIGPMDILYKIFVKKQVVLFKANPVNAYLGPLLEEGFRALIEPGYLRVVYGGAAEGTYLSNHVDIANVHITGSDKTFETIVFGPGQEGKEHKAAHQPLLQKPITGELGNVSPVIVVPGPWTKRDIEYQAEHLVTSLANNAGFNCNATRVIIQHADWSQRAQLLQQVRQRFAQLPTREAYYPGAHERYQAFIAAHPEAEKFGAETEQQLPWTLIADVDAAQTGDICFTTEAFCSIVAETALKARSVLEYIERAVHFANEHLWGTLNVTLLVHPQSLKDPATAKALEQAITNLRYGTISLNYWAGTSFALGVTTWGAFPGHDIYNIQSGTDVVHNTLMFSQAQKSVIRAPFRSTPIPPWFVSRGSIARKLFPKLVALEVTPDIKKVPGILRTALGIGLTI